MAELLIQDWNLPVLRVRLETSGDRPSVECTLQYFAEGERTPRDIANGNPWDLTEFGFTGVSGDEPHRLDVPATLVAWVKSVVDDGTMQGIGRLWLYLVRPSGALGAAPWERALVPALGMPVLRLPDVLPRPVRSRQYLEIALCASGAAAEGPSPALQTLVPLAGAIGRATAGLRVVLHVFADREAAALLPQMASAAPSIEVVNHVARWASSNTRAADRASAGGWDGWRDASPWLSMMREALRGRAIDIVHFACHGYHTGIAGNLVFAAAPDADRQQPPSVADYSGLQRFLCDLGASDVVFTAPRDNYSEAGLLQLAEDLGVDRPGTTAVHDHQLDPNMDVATAVYRLLLSDTPVPPPASPALMLMTQPRNVESLGDIRESAPGRANASPTGAASRLVIERAEPTPSWLAAATRFLEQKQGEIERFHEQLETHSDQSGDMADQVAYYDGMATALQTVRDLIDQHAESGSPPPDLTDIVAGGA